VVEHRLEGDAERVGEDLLPHQGLRTPVGDPGGGPQRDIPFGEYFCVMAEAVGDALKDRAVEVAAGVPEVQAEEGAAQVRVVQR
jgi:hypothetical protein